MHSLRIMLVEDEGVIAMLLGDLLAHMGHDICAVAATETDAVTAAVESRPDLMIVDARLREGSGVSAMGSILRTQHVPYLFITGDMAEAHELAERAVVIEKPFGEADLRRAIDQVVAAASRLEAPLGPTGMVGT